MVANAARRALRHGEREVSPRVSDLEALPASMMGKIEIEALEEGRDAQIAENLVKAAVLTVFKDRFTPERFRPIDDACEERSEERRDGKEGGRTGRSWGATYYEKNKKS